MLTRTIGGLAPSVASGLRRVPVPVPNPTGTGANMKGASPPYSQLFSNRNGDQYAGCS